MPHLIETKELTVHFGGLAAVDEVDFQMDGGEVVGLIGPNGSGKTTFLRLQRRVLPGHSRPIASFST